MTGDDPEDEDNEGEEADEADEADETGEETTGGTHACRWLHARGNSDMRLD